MQFVLPDSVWDAFTNAVVARQPRLAEATNEEKDAAAVTALRGIVAQYVGQSASRVAQAAASEAIRTGAVVERVSDPE